ncbi:hypothetical protein Bca52824_089185 [Brassica carinata]|uniref:Secreted protein n=1 Tax=Brassica carinata TaxID=52824 RepID=A0A8X7TPH9_BRACI|nr:hypothetical protein Bca52824_089185 [Brassica carinata]
MGWGFPFVLNFAGSLFFLSSSTRAEEHGTSRTCEAAKRLQKVAIRVFGAVLHPAALVMGRFVGGSLIVTGGGSGGLDTPAMRSRRTGFGGCSVNGGGSMLSQSSFPQPKFLFVM